jgi:hypothetical protein
MMASSGGAGARTGTDNAAPIRGTPAPDTLKVDEASAVSHWFGDLLR